jgi:hypothetical protein
MIVRNIGRTLIEIGCGTTASFHQSGQQVIGFL